MAKRKPLQDYGKPKTTAKSTTTTKDAASPTWQAAKVVHPTCHTTRSGKKARVARAHEKHLNDHRPPTAHPSLADRFYALPGEIRAYIFALLLVQPAKWDMHHRQGCPLITSSVDLTPQNDFRNYYTDPVSCSTGAHITRWRRTAVIGYKTWVDPWRSIWAPPQRNPYVCTACYDRNLREAVDGPFPQSYLPPCLCARRENLQTLLVCKKWYREAAHVFYTENTFTFEDSGILAAFAKNLPSQHRALITKVSLSSIPETIEATVPIFTAGPHLLLLPNISHLELDAIYLTTCKSIHGIMSLGLRNLQHLSFVARLSQDPSWMRGTPTVWPALAGRRLIQGGFAEEIARAAKGQRQHHLKGRHGKLAIREGALAAREKQREEGILH